MLGVGKQDARDIRHGHFAVWATCGVIEALVARLDLCVLDFSKAEPAVTGRPAYDPSDLLKLHVPDHKTIAEFRRCAGRALRAA